MSTVQASSEPMEADLPSNVQEENDKKKQECFEAYSKSLLSFVGVLEANNKFIDDIASEPHELRDKIIYMTLSNILNQETRVLKARAECSWKTLNDDLERYWRMSKALDDAVEEWRQESEKITATRKMTIEDALPLAVNTVKKLNEIQYLFNKKLFE